MNYKKIDLEKTLLYISYYDDTENQILSTTNFSNDDYVADPKTNDLWQKRKYPKQKIKNSSCSNYSSYAYVGREWYG